MPLNHPDEFEGDLADRIVAALNRWQDDPDDLRDERDVIRTVLQDPFNQRSHPGAARPHHPIPLGF